MPVIAWKRVLLAIAALLAGGVLLAAVSYYFSIFLPEQASTENLAKVRAIEMRLRDEYCTPSSTYPNQRVMAFCARQDLQLP